MLPVSYPAQSVGQRRLSRKTRVVSCTECHRRKQKCDRESPCNQCIQRNVENLCQYANENRRKRRSNYPSRSSVVVPPLPQPASSNPVPMLHFQSTASRLQPYPSSDLVSSVHTTAVSARPTPIPSAWPSQTSDVTFQIVALSPHCTDRSSQSYSLTGCDPGTKSMASESVDDNADTGATDDAVIIESLGYLQALCPSFTQDIGVESEGYMSCRRTTAVFDPVASLFPREQFPVENVNYAECYSGHTEAF
ncbi:hypothetical protein V1509DRAFT_631617 [Lipomyces kononenkoae]